MGKKKGNGFIIIIVLEKRNLMRIGRVGNEMDYLLNGMKMGRRKVKENTRMGKKMDYKLIGTRMD